ncbi:pilus (MSHA type) biogenesis protein MshL [Propionivibrio limicola]|uniref:pilus (MSHA type) biogenesis protein MshL n=1 Tax=Propionivibrio limicola TaxID=167645 RepID=UPI001291A556|nr:pilus (MSHA type) biogenesis protein MshL [Propionivibrio limicola]
MKCSSTLLKTLRLTLPLSASVFLSVMLGGCASHQKAPAQTFDRVGQELQGAVASRPKSVDEAVTQAMMPPVQLDLPAPAKEVEPRFDLAVSNAPATQVFMALVSGTRYSMLVSPEVSGSVTVNLKNVTVKESLETLRELYGYEFKIQGTRIHILPNALQTRIFQLNYLAGKRQGQTDVRVTSSSLSTTNPTNTTTGTTYPTTTSGSTNTTIPSSQISTAQNSDFWGDLGKALVSIVGSENGRAVIVNPASGVVVVKAFPSDIRAVEQYLKLTQLVVERQVMLEAKILEVSLNEEFQAGINWMAFAGNNNRYSLGSLNPGTSLNTTGTLTSTSGGITVDSSNTSAVATQLGQGLFGLAIQTASFASLLNFLETQGNVQVLSSPRIATVNNQKAVLKVGNDDFYVTNVSSTVTSTGTSNVTTPTITLQPFFSGIALDVTPQIDAENNVMLHVHPSVSVVTENQKVIDLGELGTYTLPLASSSVNETDSIVRVQDRNIVAIGGLMKQEQSAGGTGLPGASAASGLGWLFGTKGSYLSKRELVILIKPTIIRNESGWKDDLAETQQRIEQLDPRLRGRVPTVR